MATFVTHSDDDTQEEEGAAREHNTSGRAVRMAASLRLARSGIFAFPRLPAHLTQTQTRRLSSPAAGARSKALASRGT